jgi:hypothetical protein
MKRKADDLPEALKTVIKKCPPNEYRAPIYWVNKHSLPPRKLYDMDVYPHSDIPNVLGALLRWSDGPHPKDVTIQYVAMKNGNDYHQPLTSLNLLYKYPELYDFEGQFNSIRRLNTWRLHVRQFCPVIDIDIFKEDGDNPFLWMIWKRGYATKREIIQFTFSFVIDCLHQYIPKGDVKYFADWGSGKGIHVWFTPKKGEVNVNHKWLSGIELGIEITKLIDERGIWKKGAMSQLTRNFLVKVCRRLSISDVFAKITVPYVKTLIRQYKRNYVDNPDNHKYSNFLIRRMGIEDPNFKDNSMSISDRLTGMFGFLYPMLDILATGSLQTISLPYECKHGYYRHIYWEPETYRPGTTRYVEKDQRGVIEPSVSLSNESSVAFASLVTEYSDTRTADTASGVPTAMLFAGDVVETGPSFATFDGTTLTFTKSGTYSVAAYQTATSFVGVWALGDFVELRMLSAGSDLNSRSFSNSINWSSGLLLGSVSSGPMYVEAGDTYTFEYRTESAVGTFSQGARLEVIRLGD